MGVGREELYDGLAVLEMKLRLGDLNRWSGGWSWGCRFNRCWIDNGDGQESLKKSKLSHVAIN
jgi:hypothetical protein